MQSLSVAQLPGHPGPPPQMSGEHAPDRPVVPVSAPHVPFAAAPAAIEHAWQLPPHAALQQNPSKHPAVVESHSRHPVTLQSVVVLHADAPTLRGWHVPF
jgi:hypothetical protein